MLHSRVLGEQTQLKEEMEALRRDNAQLVHEHNHLKQSCEELKRLHGQDQKELADLRLQQQQVLLKAQAQAQAQAHARAQAQAQARAQAGKRTGTCVAGQMLRGHESPTVIKLMRSRWSWAAAESFC